MLTSSTHDTKRSADVRARITLLSELPSAWDDALQRWSARNETHRSAAGPDRETELLLYSTLVGAWPIDADRLVDVMAKSTKEAKVHTSWRSEEHTSELQSLMRISYAVFCLKKKT